MLPPRLQGNLPEVFSRLSARKHPDQGGMPTVATARSVAAPLNAGLKDLSTPIQTGRFGRNSHQKQHHLQIVLSSGILLCSKSRRSMEESASTIWIFLRN